MKIVRARRRKSQIYPGFGLSYAYPNDGPVLLEHASLGNINGFYINTRLTGCVWFLFRRTR
jgi:hypothetical protein